LLKENCNELFYQWILKAIGCYSVKSTTLSILISDIRNVQLVQLQLTDQFISSLIESTQAIDDKLKKLSLETLYLLSRYSLEYREKISYQAVKGLVYALTFKDIESKKYAVNTVVYLCESQSCLPHLIENDLISQSITCFGKIMNVFMQNLKLTPSGM